MIPAIAVEGLRKRFPYEQGILSGLFPGRRRPPVCALDGLTLEVAPGTVHGLLGPNGGRQEHAAENPGHAGSSRFRLRSGCRVRHGKRCASGAPPLGCHAGIGAQFLCPVERSPKPRILRGSLGAWVGPRSFARRRTARACRIGGRRRPAFYHLLAGNAAPDGLARALLPGPAVLLLDEPTRSLDPAAANDWGRLLRDDLARGQGKAVLLASHNLDEVEKVCDRISILVKGKIVAAGSHEELLRRFDFARLEQVYRKAVGGPKGRGGGEDV